MYLQKGRAKVQGMAGGHTHHHGSGRKERMKTVFGWHEKLQNHGSLKRRFEEERWRGLEWGNATEFDKEVINHLRNRF